MSSAYTNGDVKGPKKDAPIENGSKDEGGIFNSAFINSPDDVNSVTPAGTRVNDATVESAKDNAPDRITWGNSIEFLMSCVSMSVGLGNIWRFPFTAYENGGGAFLIPYIIVLFLIGKPMYYFEMTLGQFASRGPVKIWEVNPLVKGVGYAQMIAVTCVVSYYCSLIALSLYYLFTSMNTVMPWAECQDKWEVPNCVDSRPSNNEVSFNNNTISLEQSISSSELYFLRNVLKEKDDISDGIGNPDWTLTLYLLLAWAILFCLIIRGVKSSGKASYFLALFPYVVLVIFLIRASSLPGSGKGIKYFLEPKWGELYKPKVWYAATTQLFFSLSVGAGNIIMFSSYNQFRHNIYRDAMIVTTIDTFSSMLAGITIFAILGNLAYNLGVDDIGSVVRSGTALAFVSLPDAVSKFDSVPQLFAILFYIMLVTVGLGSGVAMINTIITIISDNFPNVPYWRFAAVTVPIGFCIGLMYVTPGGQWMLNLVDHFGATILLFALAITEMCAIFWVYGLENFCDDSEFMLNRKVSLYWRLCWSIVTPILLIIIFIYSLVDYENPTYGGMDYPDSAIVAGWLVFVVGIIQVPIWGIWLVAHNKYSESLWQKIVDSTRPKPSWGPKNPKLYAEWQEFKRRKQEVRMKKSHNHSFIRRQMNIILGRY